MVPGYAVKYEDGYMSWSPKDVFERAYFPMGPSNDNKVTPEMVEAMLGEVKSIKTDDKTTLSVAETLTGFRQYETSSCIDPVNFDMKIGEERCVKRIRAMLWKYLGFVVQWGRYGLKGGAL
jgi:hypothetical protein